MTWKTRKMIRRDPRGEREGTRKIGVRGATISIMHREDIVRAGKTGALEREEKRKKKNDV